MVVVTIEVQQEVKSSLVGRLDGEGSQISTPS
jgi:hypothetical protein